MTVQTPGRLFRKLFQVNVHITPPGSFFVAAHFRYNRYREQLKRGLWEVLSDKSQSGTSYGVFESEVEHPDPPPVNSNAYVPFCQLGPPVAPEVDELGEFEQPTEVKLAYISDSMHPDDVERMINERMEEYKKAKADGKWSWFSNFLINYAYRKSHEEIQIERARRRLIHPVSAVRRLVYGVSFCRKHELLEPVKPYDEIKVADTDIKPKSNEWNGLLPETLEDTDRYLYGLYDPLFHRMVDCIGIGALDMARKSRPSEYEEPHYAVFTGYVEEIMQEMKRDPWYKRWTHRPRRAEEQMWEAQQDITHQIVPGFMQLITPKYTPTLNLSDYDKMVIKVRGDGRKYLFQLETSYMGHEPMYYQTFITSPPGEWRVFHLKWERFVRVFMRQAGMEMAGSEFDVNRKGIQRMGFRAVGGPGPFRLDIAWIAAVHAPPTAMY